MAANFTCGFQPIVRSWVVHSTTPSPELSDKYTYILRLVTTFIFVSAFEIRNKAGMLRLRSLLVLLKIPFDLFLVILKFYLFGGIRSRKYKNSLKNCLRLRLYRSALSVEIPDGNLVQPYTNNALIKWILPLVSPTLVKDLPGYGERYDTQSFWLVKQTDRKSTDPIIIFNHGGGYYLQTSPSQLQSLLSVYRLLDPQVQSKTSILFLDYKLVSEGYPFPAQLHQLDSTYSKLVKDGNNNIILMGDSAGGHLSISYTTYLKTVPEPVTYPRKLVLVSPWVKLSPLPADSREGTSWHDNDAYDMISYSRFCSALDLKHLIGFEDPFSLQCSPGGKIPRTRDDWSSIPPFCDPDYDVFLILGEDESFRDDILQWATYALDHTHGEEYGVFSKVKGTEKYSFRRQGEQGRSNLEMYVEPLGVHDALFYFEHDVFKLVERSIKNGKKLSVNEIDSEKFFGISRVTKFLNRTLCSISE